MTYISSFTVMVVLCSFRCVVGRLKFSLGLSPTCDTGIARTEDETSKIVCPRFEKEFQSPGGFAKCYQCNGFDSHAVNFACASHKYSMETKFMLCIRSYGRCS